MERDPGRPQGIQAGLGLRGKGCQEQGFLAGHGRRASVCGYPGVTNRVGHPLKKGDHSCATDSAPQGISYLT